MTDRSTYDPRPSALELPTAIATVVRERWRPSMAEVFVAVGLDSR